MDIKLIKELLEWLEKYKEGMGENYQITDMELVEIFVLEKTYNSQKLLNKFTIVLTILTGVLVVLTAILIYITIH